MNYTQTIDYLFKKLPMFSRMGSAAFKKDLTNIVLLCSHLGNPHQQFKSIHIGGTNGKGSVSHMLAAILQTAGYKTGLYTSPHLHDFRERIRINGRMVDESFVVDFVERMKPLIEEVQPSFFEITVAMAFAFFAHEKTDVAIVEVGLGGRLDSTNIITPELSVITNISLDHTNLLGSSVQEIAFEKAGIIKPGVPVVVGEKKKETKDVFISVALQKEAPLFFAEEYFEVKNVLLNKEKIEVTVHHKTEDTSRKYILDLPGLYQAKNIITVLQAAELLENKFSFSDVVIADALQKVKKLTGLQGRWELIYEEPMVILDVAHNEEGIRQMVQHVQQLAYNKLHIVFGMVKDKDTHQVLHQLPKGAQYYFTRADIPRALPEAALQEQAAKAGLKGSLYTNVNEALQHALLHAAREDLIIVCGSIFLVAEVDRAALGTGAPE